MILICYLICTWENSGTDRLNKLSTKIIQTELGFQLRSAWFLISCSESQSLAEFSRSIIDSPSIRPSASASPHKREDSVCCSLHKSRAIGHWSRPWPLSFLDLSSLSAMHVSPSLSHCRQHANQAHLLSLVAFMACQSLVWVLGLLRCREQTRPLFWWSLPSRLNSGSWCGTRQPYPRAALPSGKAAGRVWPLAPDRW